MASPHDALFKNVIGDPEHARGVLRAVVPAALAEALDWPTLVHQPGSFVDPGLGGQHTDLLFSVAWQGGSDEALVYVLFEHQSTPGGGLMAYRLLRYMVRIWERWSAEHPDARTLPLIVPLVLYHGAARWSAPRSFDALLQVPAGVRPALEPYLVRFAYLLDDLSAIPDEVLHARAMMTALARLVEVCLKHGRTRPDLVELLGGGWVDVLREVAGAAGGLEALAMVMRYILEVNEHVDPEALKALLEREIGTEAKDTIVTAAQRYIQQGIEQGLEQGRQQGVQQGQSALLLQLLRQRFGDAVNAEIERRLRTASAAQLEIWTGRVLSAATLAELLAD